MIDVGHNRLCGGLFQCNLKSINLIQILTDETESKKQTYTEALRQECDPTEPRSPAEQDNRKFDSGSCVLLSHNLYCTFYCLCRHLKLTAGNL